MRYWILALALLQGCAVSKQTYLADGRKGLSIDCSGGALNWGYCERKAGAQCKERGYEVVTALEDKHPISFSQAVSTTTASATQQGTSGNANYNANANSYGWSGANISRTMLITCK